MSNIVKEYTPGPWQVFDSKTYGLMFGYGPMSNPIKHSELAIMAEDGDDQPWQVGKFSPEKNAPGKPSANARLISAVPELVEALINSIKSRAVIAYLQSKSKDFDDLETMADFVNANWVQSATDEERAALTKAGILIK